MAHGGWEKAREGWGEGGSEKNGWVASRVQSTQHVREAKEAKEVSEEGDVKDVHK